MTLSDSEISHISMLDYVVGSERKAYHPTGDPTGDELCHPERHRHHQHLCVEAMWSLDEGEPHYFVEIQFYLFALGFDFLRVCVKDQVPACREANMQDLGSILSI
jgi:hypothetical protein